MQKISVEITDEEISDEVKEKLQDADEVHIHKSGDDGKEVDIDIEWQGVGINEKGIDIKNGKILVEVGEEYFRPAEVELLLGDPSKAEKELGWIRKISFQELVSCMVRYDIENDDFGGKEL